MTIKRFICACSGSIVLVLGASGPVVAVEEPPHNRRCEPLPGFAFAGQELDNGIIRAGIADTYGARLMNLSLAGQEFLWHDADRAMVEPDRITVGGNANWWFGNIGGMRMLPGPQTAWKQSEAVIQGWPPPPTLDRGPYTCTTAPGLVECQSLPEANVEWACMGIQLRYVYRLQAQSSRLTLAVGMHNLSDRPFRGCIWQIASVLIAASTPESEGSVVTFPIRSKPSRFGAGGVMEHGGLIDDGVVVVDQGEGVVRLATGGRSRKLGSDSDGGWLACWDPARHIALVERFPHDPRGLGSLIYPEGGSTVSVYLPESAPWGELEIMTPETTLKAGESQKLEVEFASCALTGPVVKVSEGGAASARLRVDAGVLVGRFGVFECGEAVLSDGAGTRLASWPCDPRRELAVSWQPEGAMPSALRLEVVAQDAGTVRALDSWPRANGESPRP